MGCNLNFDPFYPIFDSSRWLEKLLPLGIRLVQIRIKDKSEAETQHEIQRSRDLCEKYQCQLVVNDYWQIALDLGCNYVHLGQEDLDQADLAMLKKSNIRFGISTHSEAELERALALDPDYIALGPVYPTILKKMPWQPQGLERVTRWKQQIGDLPLIGIGGMNLDRAMGVFQAGADAVAMVTDITLNPEPQVQVNDWIQLTEPWRSGQCK
jgi:thiamine-phosphate pyrophosphorylase